MRKIALDDIHCCRWSGANEPEPAVMKDGIPCPLSREQAERALVEALSERESLREEVELIRHDLSEIRRKSGKFIGKIKAMLGYKNWPDIEGNFLDGVAELIEKRLKK